MNNCNQNIQGITAFRLVNIRTERNLITKLISRGAVPSTLTGGVVLLSARGFRSMGRIPENFKTVDLQKGGNRREGAFIYMYIYIYTYAQCRYLYIHIISAHVIHMHAATYMIAVSQIQLLYHSKYRKMVLNN